MSAEKKQKKTISPKGKSPSPSVIWAVLAKQIVWDQKSGSVSAINIVEDIYLPENVFVKNERKNIVDLGQQLVLAFTMDWKFPEEIAEDVAVSMRLKWTSPSGTSFTSGEGNPPLHRPAIGLRTHVEAGLKNLPVEEQGIYQLQIMLNDTCAAIYPIRVHAHKEKKGLTEQPETLAKKVAKRKVKVAKKDVS